MKTYIIKEPDRFEMEWEINESIRYKFEKQLQVRREIDHLCNELKVDLQEIHPWQLRLSQDGISIDIFPHKRQYHIVGTDSRRIYNNITGFMYRNFR